MARCYRKINFSFLMLPARLRSSWRLNSRTAWFILAKPPSNRPYEDDDRENDDNDDDNGAASRCNGHGKTFVSASRLAN